MLDNSYLSMPQYSQMTQSNQSSQFAGTFVKSALPKILLHSSVPGGNVFLYEVSKIEILLCVPEGNDINCGDVKKGYKSYETPHGEKKGYVFFKNNVKHMEALDMLFPDKSWRNHLSEPLPEPLIPKDPLFLCRKNVIFRGHQFDITVYEYSDKSLSVFSNMDISEGNEKLLKPWKNLTCPDAPGGKANGWLCYKNNNEMINFLKKFIPDIDFESMYKKSIPVKRSVKVVRDPQLLHVKKFMNGDNEFTLDVYEYSETSIVLFPTPLINFDGFQQNQNLTHPIHGVKPGYIIPKKDTARMNMIKSFIGIANLEDMYVHEEEKSSRGTGFEPTNLIAEKLSDFSIKSHEDIPIESLLRLISKKINESTELTNKNLLGGKLLIYGNTSSVETAREMNDDIPTTIQIICGDKSLYLLQHDE